MTDSHSQLVAWIWQMNFRLLSVLLCVNMADCSSSGNPRKGLVSGADLSATGAACLDDQGGVCTLNLSDCSRQALQISDSFLIVPLGGSPAAAEELTKHFLFTA